MVTTCLASQEAADTSPHALQQLPTETGPCSLPASSLYPLGASSLHLACQPSGEQPWRSGVAGVHIWPVPHDLLPQSSFPHSG